MIYITQFIYLNPNKEEVFHQFEDVAIPLISKYHGKLLSRIRPEAQNIIAGEMEVPYEIHLVSFPTEQDLQKFMKDEERQKFVHLKDQAIRRVLLIKGEKMWTHWKGQYCYLQSSATHIKNKNNSR